MTDGSTGVAPKQVCSTPTQPWGCAHRVQSTVLALLSVPLKPPPFPIPSATGCEAAVRGSDRLKWGLARGAVPCETPVTGPGEGGCWCTKRTYRIRRVF